MAKGVHVATERTVTTPTDQDWLALARSETLGVILDLDGTLIPFAGTLEEAVLDEAGARLLAELAALPGVQVVIASGRPLAAVEPLVSWVPGVWWVAEHGTWRHDGAWRALPEPALDVGSLMRRLEAIAAASPGARIEHKRLSVCFHWRQVDPELRESVITEVEAAIDEWLEDRPDLERLNASEAIEIRHPTAHKGTVVAWLRERLPAGARLLAIGDDYTDEEAFAALGPSDLAIRVGSGRGTHAAAQVGSHDDVRGILRWIAAARSGDPRDGLPVFHPVPVPRSYRVPLLVLSNRLPASSATAGGRRREVGGLVSALEPALLRAEGVWLGWSGRDRDGAMRVAIDFEARPRRAHFDHPSAWRELFYRGFCNRSLWPLLHSFPGKVRFADDEWRCYVTANNAYADAVTAIVDSDATIWAHDYHLLLTGEALRQRGHHGPIGFFLHVPFPPLDIFELMPWAEQVLTAMMSFDLIGLHTTRYRDNFVRCAVALAGARAVPDGLEHGGRHVAVDAFPIGIDPEIFAPERGAVAAREIQALKTGLGERLLILGVDRLDYSKGIIERLEAFARMLELFPEWRGQVSFVQVSVPSRAEVPEYAELRGRVETLVGRINGEYGEALWVPVRYLYRSYAPRVLAQLYRAADVAFVSPLRDGMNLVAKEFIAAQDPADPGALLLSHFTGAADELTGALLVNPYHRDGMARALDRALRMPLDERIGRYRKDIAVVRQQTSQVWSGSFLARLAATRKAEPALALGASGGGVGTSTVAAVEAD
jgi:alpha,alpha-trehalose-phosphate synthase [UDP-forming]/trehalose-phosphatase